ncbi:phosphatase 2C-like domain-containing protein [Dipodascopsis uninucleata]
MGLRSKSGTSSPPPGGTNPVARPSWFSGTFTVGVSEDKNAKCRSTMEDTHMVVYDFGAPGAANDSEGNGSQYAGLISGKSKHSTKGFTGWGSSSENSNKNKGELPSSNGNNVKVVKHISNDAGYFAVFDGHAGKAAADWCGKKLHSLLETNLKKDATLSVPEILDATFTEADNMLAKLSLRNAGCTAVVAVIRWEDRPLSQDDDRIIPEDEALKTSNVTNQHHLSLHMHKKPEEINVENITANMRTSDEKTIRERMLYTANAGDARIVLCRAGRAIRLSYDHKGTDPNEAQRVKNCGGMVLNGRVNGILAVTRALGDTYIKKLVTSHPYTTETALSSADEFIILACDGLWDVCSDQEAVDLIRNIKEPEEASRVLVDYALTHFSMDNITCMIVRFDNTMGELIKRSHHGSTEVDDTPRIENLSVN